MPDGVVFAADGRRVHPQAKNSAAVDNEVDKLVCVGPTTFAIPFGVTQATDEALNILRERVHPGLSPEAFAHEVNSSVAAAWAFLNTRLATDVDPNHPSMRAALIVGGLAGQIPFLTAALHGPGIKQEPLLLKACDLQFILLGGEQYSASQFFTEETRRLLASITWNPAAGPLNPTVSAILEASANTIRHIESCDPTVGGTKRYAIIRSGFPIEKGVL